jgi:hypothetical protein
MTQQTGIRDVAGGGAQSAVVAIEWAGDINEEGGPMRWLGSWLVDGDEVEGDWFYGGHGNERTEHAVPPDTRGVRVRRWISEGLDPEYVDVMLNGETTVRTATLDFDTPQSHRVFRTSGG